MKTAVMVALVLGVAVPIVLGLYWLFWCLWTWVMPQVWPTGPEALIQPGYWLFVGILLLLGFIGRTLFPSRKSG